MIETGADGKPEIEFLHSVLIQIQVMQMTSCWILMARWLLITRKVIRTALRKERRRKNTAAARRNVRSVMLAELLKLDRAEI